MTGEIGPEIGAQLKIAYELLPDLADTWIAALDSYCFERRDKGPVEAWPKGSVICAPSMVAQPAMSVSSRS
jgi:hypothetical protein